MTRQSKTVTPEQRLIINHSGSHALVKAVPGSGKTTTLVKRVQRLLQNGVMPNQILVLMYNKAAQISFTDKLKLILNEYPLPEVRTFHSLALELVKGAVQSGKLAQKRLLTTGMPEYRSIIQEAYRYGYDSENSFIEHNEVKDLEEFISKCHTQGVAAEEIVGDPIFANSPKEQIKAYLKFDELLKQNSFRTFGSMLTEAKQLIAEQPQLIRQRSHIIVDEYQDVNLVQHEIIKLLAGNHASVMAVGDINQSIYQWRGSRPDFIDGLFELQFQPVRVFYLSCTFRFGHQLSLIANSLISRNTQKTAKLCVSQPAQTPHTEVHLHLGLYILKALSLITPGADSTAILARTNAHLAEAELALRLCKIPYTYPDENAESDNGTEKSNLFKRKELCVLVVAILLSVDGDLRRLSRHNERNSIISNFLQDAGFNCATGQMKDAKVRLNKNADIWQIIREILQNGRKQNLKLKDLLSLKGAALGKDLAADVYHKISLTGLIASIGQNSVNQRESNDQNRGMLRINELLQSSNITAEEFLSAVLNTESVNSDFSAVTLATFHTAKGLEYDTVIITGLKDIEFPCNGQQGILTDDDDSLQEERRIFYVGITRAKKKLHLLVPPDKLLEQWLDKGWNTTPKKEPIATRFVFELGLTECTRVSQAIYAGTAERIGSLSNRLLREYVNNLTKLV